MKKNNFLLTLISIAFTFSLNAQTCPDGGNAVRWLGSGSGLFVMDWSTANDAQVMLDNLVSITVVDGVATVGTYADPNPALNFTAEPAASWNVVNGPGTSQRIRPVDGAFAANGVGNSSVFTGVVTFNLTAGGPLVCDYTLSILPIHLIGFSAKSREKSVLLNWQTLEETDNSYMAVERSTDGRTFKEIGKVEGSGNSEEVIEYSLEDTNPENGINYYRLRQVDFDGSTFYSDVVQASIRVEDKPGELLVYPTLLENSDMLTIDLGDISEKNVIVNIYNISGQLIDQYSSFGAEELMLSVDSFESGIYIVKAENIAENLVGRFIKK